MPRPVACPARHTQPLAVLPDAVDEQQEAALDAELQQLREQVAQVRGWGRGAALARALQPSTALAALAHP
jgi:hypothetical protein